MPDLSAYLPEWVVHLLARLILLLRRHNLAAGHCRAPGTPSWLHAQRDLPPGAGRALAASVRSAPGHAIEWTCRRLGIDPDGPDWPQPASPVAAFGGGVHGCRAGLVACGLPWWESSETVPGVIGTGPGDSGGRCNGLAPARLIHAANMPRPRAAISEAIQPSPAQGLSTN